MSDVLDVLERAANGCGSCRDGTADAALLRELLAEAPPESWGSADYKSAAVILCLRAEEADALNEVRSALPSLLDEIEKLRQEKEALLSGIESLRLDVALTGDERIETSGLLDILATPLRKHGRILDDGQAARAERADIESRKL